MAWPSTSIKDGYVVMSSTITHAQSFSMHPLTYILGTFTLISTVAPFLQFTQSHPVTASPGDGEGWDPIPRQPSECGRAVRKNTGTKQKWLRETQSSAYALGAECSKFLHYRISIKFNFTTTCVRTIILVFCLKYAESYEKKTNQIIDSVSMVQILSPYRILAQHFLMLNIRDMWRKVKPGLKLS